MIPAEDLPDLAARLRDLKRDRAFCRCLRPAVAWTADRIPLCATCANQQIALPPPRSAYDTEEPDGDTL